MMPNEGYKKNVQKFSVVDMAISFQKRKHKKLMKKGIAKSSILKKY